MTLLGRRARELIQNLMVALSARRGFTWHIFDLHPIKIFIIWASCIGDRVDAPLFHRRQGQCVMFTALTVLKIPRS